MTTTTAQIAALRSLGMPSSAVQILGYQGKYFVTPEGVVWSTYRLWGAAKALQVPRL